MSQCAIAWDCYTVYTFEPMLMKCGQGIESRVRPNICVMCLEMSIPQHRVCEITRRPVLLAQERYASVMLFARYEVNPEQL